MQWQRLGLAVLLAAAGIAGVWVVTDSQDSGQTVRVDAPASQPADAQPAGIPAGLTINDIRRQLNEAMAGQRFCEAPPVEMTEEQKQLVEKIQSTLPPPPTVPGDTASGVVENIHRRVVPC